MSKLSAAVNTALQRCKTTFKVTVFRKGKTKQVLFLEAGKDFVDTLFCFLVLPVGTVIHMLSQVPGVQVKPIGGISSIFQSVDSSFLNVDKQYLVQPRPAAPGCSLASSTGLSFQRDLEAAKILQPTDSPSALCYMCPTCFRYSGSKGASCGPFCKYSVGPYPVHKLDPNWEAKLGFVKENINFIVTDRLEIIPSTVNSGMSLLKKLEVASVHDLESNEISVNITQILQLLHVALTSNNCLNDVFGVRK